MTVLQASQAEAAYRSAIVLDLGDLDRQGKAIIAQARERASSLLREARQERRRILAGAASEGVERGVAAGLRTGREAGIRQGREQAIARVQTDACQLLESWGQALEDFAAARQAILAHARSDLLELAMEIARRVTHRVIAADPEVVRRQLEAAIGLVLYSTRLRIEVHPADVELAREILPPLLETIAQRPYERPDAEIISNEHLSRGSCVVRTDHGYIDGCIDSQLDRIAAALVPGQAEPGGGGGGGHGLEARATGGGGGAGGNTP